MAKAPEGGRIKCPKCGQVFVLRRRRAAPAPGGAQQPASAGGAPASPTPPPALAVDTEVAGHKILEYVGGSQMTATYKASQTSMGRTVLFKVLQPEYATDGAVKVRFFERARGAARLNHPNLLSVFDMGEEGGVCFYTTEFVEGSTLAQLAGGSGRVSSKRRLSIATQITRALAHAESAGVKQVWLGPGDVMLTDKEDVRVAHVGMSAPLSGGSPELIMAALARLVYVTATGRDLPPAARRAGGAPVALAPARDALDNKLNAVILRLLNEPGAFKNIVEFEAELEKLSESVQRRSTVDASAPGGVVPLRLERARHRKLPVKGILIATVLGTALCALVLYTMLSARRTRQREQAAQDLWRSACAQMQVSETESLLAALATLETLARDYADTPLGRKAKMEGIDQAKMTIVHCEYEAAEAEFKDKPRELEKARSAIKGAQERLDRLVPGYALVEQQAKVRIQNVRVRYWRAAKDEWDDIVRKKVRAMNKRQQFAKSLAEVKAFEEKWPEASKTKENVAKVNELIKDLARYRFGVVMKQVNELRANNELDTARTLLQRVVDNFGIKEYVDRAEQELRNL